MKIRILLMLLAFVALKLNAQNWSAAAAPNANNIYYEQGKVTVGGPASLSTAHLHIGKLIETAGTPGEVNRLSFNPYGHTGGFWYFRTRDTQANAFMDITYGTTNIFTVEATGKVGIGTSVISSADLNIGKQLEQPGTPGEANRLSISPFGHTGSYWYFKTRDTQANAFLDITYGTTNIFTVETTGKVGIGTSVTSSADVNIGKQLAQPGTPGEINRLSISPYGHTGNYWFLKARDLSDATFLEFTYGNTGVFTMDGNGNVGIGIGTSRPDARLTVGGDIHSREVRVTINAGSGPDFVFHDNYNLRTLDQVEAFILKNKHLPDIEPASEMEEKGVELGKMDMKLLQKIEEMTLYMIEFRKEMDAMKKENARLKEEIAGLKKD
jgi:hypothetical protein